jgi:amino acid adenylation domain-containing protein
MGDNRNLFELLARSASRSPDRVAVEEADGGVLRYRELLGLADRTAAWLTAVAGVRRGDRVGIYLRKSIDGVASIFGILKCGAAYVPLDPLASASRNAYILDNCKVKAVIVEQRFADALRPELERLGHTPVLLIVAAAGAGRGLHAAVEEAQPGVPSVGAAQPGDLAYVLYTSGSTGRPKGVMLSHANALLFIDWCSDTFRPTENDRFSSHAPFHFDLSVLDLYVPLKHGATIVLFGETLGKEPLALGRSIAEKRISNWYSAPSILSMLAQQGRLEQYDWSHLRMVLFAGEVFPIKHLRTLKSLWPAPKYFNLYGPTETNVCTWFEIPSEIPQDRTEPYPIGQVCPHYQDLVIDGDGERLPAGVEGELCLSGPGVMQGYWDLPEQNAQVFLTDQDGTRWYRTGDIVVHEPDGNYRFLGRRDRMIKKRGYRVELGEIEAALYRHQSIKEAAVVARENDEGVSIHAFVGSRDGQRLSIIALKQFCAEQLPLYMVPDRFTFLPELPKTSTDKIAYRQLEECL